MEQQLNSAVGFKTVEDLKKNKLEPPSLSLAELIISTDEV